MSSPKRYHAVACTDEWCDGAVEPEEQWRPIPDWEGYYSASNLGRVRSEPRVIRNSLGRDWPVPGGIRKARTERQSGYQVVTLARSGGRIHYRVHRLVLTAFCGPRPAGLEGRHLDGDPSNNALSNLIWGTPRENMRDVVRHGRHHLAQKSHCLRGHLLVHPNLAAALARRGYRDCLACVRARAVVRNAKRRGRVLDLAEQADRRYRQIMAGHLDLEAA